MPAPAPVRVSPAVAVTSAATHAPAEAARNEASAEQAGAAASPVEPNIDRMLREIFEGRGSGAPEAAAPPPSAGTASAEAAKPSPAEEKPAAETEDGEGKPQSLADRLRVV
jgi:hypothetical protein